MGVVSAALLIFVFIETERIYVERVIKIRTRDKKEERKVGK